MFSEAFDEEILGMKKGQTKEFTLEIPEDETAVLLAGQAGKPVTFEVTCNVVKKKVTPEVTDEWAKEKMGFESVEDMRERIKESLNAQKGSLMPRIKENNIMVELRDRVEGDVPESPGRAGRDIAAPGLLRPAAAGRHDLRRLPGQPEHHARPVQGRPEGRSPPTR